MEGGGDQGQPSDKRAVMELAHMHLLSTVRFAINTVSPQLQLLWLGGEGGGGRGMRMRVVRLTHDHEYAPALLGLGLGKPAANRLQPK